MKRSCFRLVSGLTLMGLGLAGTALLAEQVSLDYGVVQVVNKRKLVVAVQTGEFRGRYSLTLDKPAEGVEKGQRGHIRADRQVLERRSGPVTVQFKGSDEELQAIIDPRDPQ